MLAATSFCQSPSSPLRFLRWSPKVLGPKTGAGFFKDLSRIRAYGKKATRRWRFIAFLPGYTIEPLVFAALDQVLHSPD